MILTKFNFLTLIFSALLTFNVNATTCNNDEFDNLIEKQESANPTEIEALPTESEYISAVNRTLSSVATDTSAILEETIADTAIITAETAVSVLGAIGVVVAVGVTIYNIVTTFEDPKSTVIDKTTVLAVAAVPVLGLIIMLVNDFGPSPYRKVRNKIDDSLKVVAKQYAYTSSKKGAASLESFVLKVEKNLTESINNTASSRKVHADYSKILLRHYVEQYLLSAKRLNDNLSKIYAKQWMKASPHFIALNTALNGAVSEMEIAPPDIISSQTLALCKVDDDHYFLSFKGKKANQIKKCLDGIFYDYKTHFKGYTLDDTITISAPDLKQTPPVEVVQNTSFNEFLTSYAKAYNHFLSNIKIKYANSIYKENKEMTKTICHKQKTSGEAFLEKAKEEVWSLAESIFRGTNHINNSGQSIITNCWHGREYLCKVKLKYEKDKDVSITPALAKIDALRVLIDDAHQYCVEGEYHGDDSSHDLFVNALNTDRFFPMLNEENTSKLFSDIFQGVKAVLLFSVKRQSKIAYESRKQ